MQSITNCSFSNKSQADSNKSPKDPELNSESTNQVLTKDSKKIYDINPLKVFVGGIPTDVTEEQFEECFKKYGDIASSTLAMDVHRRNFKGFGFVLYKTVHDADLLYKKPVYLNTKKLDVKLATTSQEAKHQILEEKSRKLFIGNLDERVNEEILMKKFKEFGEVEKCQVIYNHDTKKSRGFGFVIFDTEEVTQKLLESNKIYMYGRKIKIKTVLLRNEVNCYRKIINDQNDQNKCEELANNVENNEQAENFGTFNQDNKLQSQILKQQQQVHYNRMLDYERDSNDQRIWNYPDGSYKNETDWYYDREAVYQQQQQQHQQNRQKQDWQQYNRNNGPYAYKNFGRNSTEMMYHSQKQFNNQNFITEKYNSCYKSSPNYQMGHPPQTYRNKMYCNSSQDIRSDHNYRDYNYSDNNYREYNYSDNSKDYPNKDYCYYDQDYQQQQDNREYENYYQRYYEPPNEKSTDGFNYYNNGKGYDNYPAHTNEQDKNGNIYHKMYKAGQQNEFEGSYPYQDFTK